MRGKVAIKNRIDSRVGRGSVALCSLTADQSATSAFVAADQANPDDSRGRRGTFGQLIFAPEFQGCRGQMAATQLRYLSVKGEFHNWSGQRDRAGGGPHFRMRCRDRWRWSSRDCLSDNVCGGTTTRHRSHIQIVHSGHL